ncbi:hypothetical protein NQ314_020700 [Rhamnusium bicolor]|uniref:Uncharacterized protein n=1 Tax=Rhamnusium bicolor TaxID=1586634 RepID=A0AAV8WJR3_9CUCU|nr:hypothetical protein NQ314_020700 [Rhamnusium bicolor]
MYELFERRDAKSPIRIATLHYNIPRLVYDCNIRQRLAIKINKYFVFTPEYIASAVEKDFERTIFNFCFALKLSYNDLF